MTSFHNMAQIKCTICSKIFSSSYFRKHIKEHYEKWQQSTQLLNMENQPVHLNAPDAGVELEFEFEPEIQSQRPPTIDEAQKSETFDLISNY